MGNFLNNNNNINFNPLCTEITDYYDVEKFDKVFDNEIDKYNVFNDFSDLQKGLRAFLSLNKDQGFLFYKRLLDTDSGIKIFIKIYFLERINNKIRYSSLQLYDIYSSDIDYITYTKNLFQKHFNFLNIKLNQINFFFKCQTITFNDNDMNITKMNKCTSDN